MRYLAETEDIERDGPQEDASDWDSLSDRVRKRRQQQKTLLQQHRGEFSLIICQFDKCSCNNGIKPIKFQL